MIRRLCKLPARALRSFALLPALVLLAGCFDTDIPPAGSYSDILLVTEEGINDPLTYEVIAALEWEIDYYVSSDYHGMAGVRQV